MLFDWTDLRQFIHQIGGVIWKLVGLKGKKSSIIFISSEGLFVIYQSGAHSRLNLSLCSDNKAPPFRGKIWLLLVNFTVISALCKIIVRPSITELKAALSSQQLWRHKILTKGASFI